jgi:hypothetical protein
VNGGDEVGEGKGERRDRFWAQGGEGPRGARPSVDAKRLGARAAAARHRARAPMR